MRTLEVWQIDSLKRQQEEQERQYDQNRQSIQLPLYEPYDAPVKAPPESDRGVCIIDYSGGE